MALTKVSTGVVDMSQDTGGLIIAKGTTAQQPTCTAANLGSIRENTDENKVEVCTANSGTPAWQFLEEAGPSFIPLTVEYLVVAGGGGGGNFDAGGGGAGGYLTNFGGTAITLSSGDQKNISIGKGGTGGIKVALTSQVGSNSSFDTITSYGGGGGASDNNTGPSSNGGSGGGAAGGSNSTVGLAVYGAQGNDGGTASGNLGGGGGGAGEAGNTDGQGYGGDGLSNSITGTTTFYAGGGGGDFRYVSSGGGAPGGEGGGGDGSATTANNGTPGTGGGGGALGNTTSSQGGTGGSGVVILRFPISYSAPTISNISPTGGLTITNSTDVTHRIVTYTCATNTTVSATLTF